MAEKDNKTIFIVIVVIAVILIAVFLVFPGKVKTILEHREPADISEEEEGTGLYLKLYDEDGNEIEIPDWFKVSSIMDTDFTIVRHPPAPACTTRTQCSGYLTIPNIMCWNLKCVLGDVASMDLGVSVVNPAASEIIFTNVAPSLPSEPSEFWTKLDKTPVTLNPGDPAKLWMTTSPISIGIWEGLEKTFKVTVAGTNEYTGTTFSTSDSIQLAFDADPTGAFTVSIVSPV